MSDNLQRIQPCRKKGIEEFHFNGGILGFDLLDFWQWSASDLVGNVLRGRLAEYLVARALGLAVDVRAEWDAYDLCTPAGDKIEVKSAAFIQSWTQTRHSAIRFGISPTRGWDASTNELSHEVRRQANVYVFCLLHNRDQATLDPLDVSQWTFYVLPTKTLDEACRKQREIGLASLLRLQPHEARFDTLAATIQDVIQYHASARDALVSESC